MLPLATRLTWSTIIRDVHLCRILDRILSVTHPRGKNCYKIIKEMVEDIYIHTHTHITHRESNFQLRTYVLEWNASTANRKSKAKYSSGHRLDFLHEAVNYEQLIFWSLTDSLICWPY